MKTLHAKSKIEISSKEDGFKFIASSEAVDRHGEVVKQDGWDLKNYLSNPVILWGHDYYKMPVGKATKIYVENAKLIVEGIWASAAANPEAEQIRNLYLEGMVNAVSVGFIAKEWEGNVITKAELLEISLVTVPANQEALSLLKSKGFSDDIMSGFSIKEALDDVEITEDAKPEEVVAPVEEVVEEKVEEEITPVEEVKVEEEVIEEEDDMIEIVEEKKEIEAEEDITVEGDEEEMIEVVDENDDDALDTNDEILDTKEDKGLKAGRTLSDATRKTIQDSIDAMESSITALKILLQESDTSKAVDGLSVVTLDKEKQVVVDKVLLEQALSDIRGNDRRNTLVMETIKSVLNK